MPLRCSTLLSGLRSSVGSQPGEYCKCVGFLYRLLHRPWCSGHGFPGSGSRDSYKAAKGFDFTPTEFQPTTALSIVITQILAFAPLTRLENDFLRTEAIRRIKPPAHYLTENLKTVVLSKVSRGCSTTDGKFGLLIESGKCCVS